MRLGAEEAVKAGGRRRRQRDKAAAAVRVGLEFCAGKRGVEGAAAEPAEVEVVVSASEHAFSKLSSQSMPSIVRTPQLVPLCAPSGIGQSVSRRPVAATNASASEANASSRRAYSRSHDAVGAALSSVQR